MAMHSSGKYLQLSKAQQQMLAIIAVAMVVCVFSLVGFKTMLAKGNYQRKVLNEKHKVIAQLETNLTNVKNLATQYQTFTSANPNVLGGNATGNGNRDGSNAQIAIDSLPTKYNTPALASSLEKLLTADAASIHSIKVQDNPTGNSDIAVVQPGARIIPFSFEAGTSFSSAKQIFLDFERSIRPFDVTKVELSGSDQVLLVSTSMNTYYQPAQSLDLNSTKEVQ